MMRRMAGILSSSRQASWLLALLLGVSMGLGACSTSDDPADGPRDDRVSRDRADDDGGTADADPDQTAPDADMGGDGADAEPADACPPPPDLDGGVFDGTVPELLSETGLYADVATGKLAEGVRFFQPRYVLWSDSAAKSRWYYIPPCSQIDTSDMDHWVVPVGAKFWKEFVRDGVRVETRMIWRYGPAPSDFAFAGYHWREDMKDAVYVPMGVPDASGTEHDIPSTRQCRACHQQLPDRVLGFSAIQLSHQLGGENIDSLSAEGRLTVPAPKGGFHPPGDELTAQALGYLHANCGNCHNPSGIDFVTPFDLRLSVSDMTLEETGVGRTAINVPVEFLQQDGVTHRIVPGDVAASGVPFRMSVRGTRQMPPLGTEIVDDVGLQQVSDWVAALSGK